MKLFLEETGSEAMLLLVEQMLFTPHYFSSLARVEVASAISRKVRLGEVTRDAARDALSQFAIDAAERAIEVPIDSAIIASASGLTSNGDLRTLDAIQLASALKVQQQTPADSLIFTCADDRLLQAAQQRHLEVFNPLIA